MCYATDQSELYSVVAPYFSPQPSPRQETPPPISPETLTPPSHTPIVPLDQITAILEQSTSITQPSVLSFSQEIEFSLPPDFSFELQALPTA